MKRFIGYLFMSLALIMNAYLIFYWKPEQGDYNIKKEYENSVGVISYSKSIYTENKHDIIKNLCNEDKNDLKIIVSKLSTSDIGRVEECFKLLDENEGLVEAFKIFSTRLSSHDYAKIREIFSDFIDIEYLDDELKK